MRALARDGHGGRCSSINTRRQGLTRLTLRVFSHRSDTVHAGIRIQYSRGDTGTVVGEIEGPLLTNHLLITVHVTVT